MFLKKKLTFHLFPKHLINYAEMLTLSSKVVGTRKLGSIKSTSFFRLLKEKFHENHGKGPHGNIKETY